MADKLFVPSETLSAERAKELNKAESDLEVMTNILKELDVIGEKDKDLEETVEQGRKMIAVLHRTQEIK